jgi:acylphosphatase
MDTPKLEVKAVVKGLVQGVGFRYKTREFAQQLDLKGTVRNCPDGSVEIVVQGPHEKIYALIKQLKNTRGLGRIESVETFFREPEKLFLSFQIIH